MTRVGNWCQKEARAKGGEAGVPVRREPLGSRRGCPGKRADHGELEEALTQCGGHCCVEKPVGELAVKLGAGRWEADGPCRDKDSTVGSADGPAGPGGVGESSECYPHAEGRRWQVGRV